MNQSSENRTCQSCKKDFTIEPEDFDFYEKMDVPPPTWCPECRMIRRLAYREDRPLYKDKCDKCGKDIISIFAPESSLYAYCSPCWWGDGWDASTYGKDYDFGKTFFEQFHELQKVVPREATGSKNSTNCQFSNGNIRCKNCTLTFDGYESINCYNCQSPVFSRDSLDTDMTFNSDHAYETVNSNGVYNTRFVYFSDECLDSAFLFNCVGCSNCFGCVNLRNQKYQIFNKQYTKEGYRKEIKKWDLSSYEMIQKAKKKFLELYYRTPRKFILITNSTNVIGDDIKNTKNCKTCFATRHGVENCKYVFLCGLLLKDSMDVTFGGETSELFYEKSGGTESQRCMFSRACNNSHDIRYSDRVFNCSDLFGCVHLKNKKYCILNKQYNKEEYEELVPKIIEQMNTMPYVDKVGRVFKYGEFFPSNFALWAYNETWAHKYFPLSKKEALEKGFNWHDEEDKNYEITIKTEDLPDDIRDVSSEILGEVIECAHKGNCNQQCTRAFRILPNELQFYKQMNLALPRLCPNCRFSERINIKNPLKLWHRKCMCAGTESENGKYVNTIQHSHGDTPCDNEFETAISDERREIVYCEKCYQAEFI
ncbi:MAG: hypothetical protein WC783_01735 [Candidatus Paceibacterota bacterium]|jgi:hypothetical protein